MDTNTTRGSNAGVVWGTNRQAKDAIGVTQTSSRMVTGTNGARIVPFIPGRSPPEMFMKEQGVGALATSYGYGLTTRV